MEPREILSTDDSRSVQRRRWWIHLILMISLAGSLLSLIVLSRTQTLHVVVGLVFVVVMGAHLLQRRRTIGSWVRSRRATMARRQRRTMVSDTILFILVLDVVVSGTVDAVNHQETQLNLGGVLPPGLDQWHKLAGLLLFIYACVHVIRRRRRLRSSHIR